MQLVPYTPPVVTNDVAVVTTYPLEKLLSVSIPLTLLVRISEFKLGSLSKTHFRRLKFAT